MTESFLENRRNVEEEEELRQEYRMFWLLRL